ncbi:glycosyltransferase [Actinoplanes friuliensis]|uniref:glycosyltransferase n=1 Tax=Actinoplanes friuliensis TaxID=196914 RepID=UPI0005A1F47E|nr:glycosyltransferase [Actinoplanes friuliensis]
MRDLAVIVPAYNEAVLLPGALAALAAQTDRDFTLVVVDNASTDDTAALAAAFPGDVEVIPEPAPGAGTAADTGFRHAIAGGATRLLRTDADCLPALDWVSTGRALLDTADLICGRSVPRHDEHPGLIERRLYPAAVRLAARFGRLQHRGPEYRCPFVLVHGHNLAITAALYDQCGGTPREALGDGSEDVTLLNRARRHSDRIIRAENLVVESSLRRLRAWGSRRTLLWSWDRRYRPAPDAVHVR